MRKVYIVTSGDMITGGPEVSHQLADALNQDVERAFMVYFPARFDVPAPYRNYRVRPVAAETIEPDSIVVLPEPCAQMVTCWPRSDIYFWWLSVDGAAIAANIRGSDLDEELRTLLQRHVTKHLYASEYARSYLADRGVAAHRLFDPQRLEYRQALAQPLTQERPNLLVYNPKKGGEARTRQILDMLDGRIEAIPITNMLPDKVQDLLTQAKVCIDFGDHPGKDRLPREAAACGACVLVNQRGSAANALDVPIPDEFKIDDTRPGFEHVVADKVRALMDDFPRQQARFNDYRNQIAQDSADFFEDVAAIFPQ